MTIKSIKANLDCDNCGEVFTVELDPAANVTGYLSLADYIEHVADIIGEHILCPRCAITVAKKLFAVEDPTHEQVQRSLRDHEFHEFNEP